MKGRDSVSSWRLVVREVAREILGLGWSRALPTERGARLVWFAMRYVNSTKIGWMFDFTLTPVSPEPNALRASPAMAGLVHRSTSQVP